jgi:hypothetical protein
LRGILPRVYAGRAIHGPCRLFLRGILPGQILEAVTAPESWMLGKGREQVGE